VKSYCSEKMVISRTSFVQEGGVYQTASVNGDGPGFFTGITITVPVYQVVGTFEVAGWTGNYASYAVAELGPPGSVWLGQTGSFTNAEGNPSVSGQSPVGLAGAQGSGWDGNLVLVNRTPEPSTIALVGVGAATFLMFRRRLRAGR